MTGLPGVGKTVFAAGLASALGDAPVVSTDAVRSIVRQSAPATPWLDTVSHEAWMRVGPPSEESFATGFRDHAGAVMAVTRSVVADHLRKFDRVVVEGIHAYPGCQWVHGWKVAWFYLESEDLAGAWRKKALARRGAYNVWQEHAGPLGAIEQVLLGGLSSAEPVYRVRTAPNAGWPFDEVRRLLKDVAGL